MNTFTMVNITPCVRDSLEDKFVLSPPKNAFLLPSVWPRTKNILWKKSLLIYFESYHGIPYSQRQTRKSMVKIFHIVNTTQYVRDSLRINFAVYSFLSSSVRNQRKPGLYLQQADNILGLNPQLFCQKIDKKCPLVKWTAQYVFSKVEMSLEMSLCFFKGVDALQGVDVLVLI